jgi:alkylresorcinol/alkylpyrone synthase
VPPYKIDQATARDYALARFAGTKLNLKKLADVFEHAQIKSRYSSVPVEWFQSPKTFLEKNQAYIENCDKLGAAAARECLDKAGVKPGQVDYIIFVSTTGLATPSIDARLINILGLQPHVRRTPVWGLGCAGGAAALSHAYHHLLGHPGERVLIVAAELCGLTFQYDDLSRSNFIATALFGDGAAAVLVAGGGTKSEGLEVLGTRSTFWPDSLDVMGWNMMNTGMQVVFSQSIPRIVGERSRGDIDSFLAGHGKTLADISHLIVHPGGAKVIEAYETALGLAPGKMDICRDVLRDYGNVSSVSVLYVLDEHLRRFPLGSGGYGLVSALGPGFCSESLLVRF